MVREVLLMEIIAEIGQNHNGDIKLAKKLIAKAKLMGADTVKFQVYNAKKLFQKKNNPWFEYNCKTELNFEQIEILFEECQKKNIEFMASVFDEEKVEWLEKIGVRRYKVASRSIFENDLIKKIIKTKKPLIVSLGFWKKKTLPSIFKSSKVAFLHCISEYPTELKKIKFSKISFKQICGFSDHTIGTSASKIALSRGAKIIEKHFTLSHKLFGPDHLCSMTPEELKEISKFRDDLRKCL